MSVRFDASADRLTYTGSDVGPFGGATATWTMMAWIRFVSSPSAYSVFFSLDRAADYHTFGTTSSGLQHSCQRGSGSETDFRTLFVLGRWYHVAYVRTGGTTVVAYVNGHEDGTAVMDSGVPTSIIIGSDHDSEFLNGNMQAVKVWKRRLSQDEIIAEMRYDEVLNPTQLLDAWQLSSTSDLVGTNGRKLVVGGTLATATHAPCAMGELPRGRYRNFIASPGATAYTITADAGSYAITGSTVTVRAARIITAAAGSYSLTGTAAGLGKGYKVGASAGSYSISGTDTSLRATRVITASGGSYSLTGSNAGLKRGIVISAAAGSYVITGTAASLVAARKLIATAGSYSLTGSDVTLTYTPTGGSTYTITADGGSYTTTGSSAGLKIGYKITASGGVYTITGSNAQLVANRLMAALGGSYSITGSAAGLKIGRKVSADSGVYTFDGSSVTLTYSAAGASTRFMTPMSVW